MFKASWMVSSIVALLLSAAAPADDAKPSNADGDPLPATALSVHSLPAKTQQAAHWELFSPVDAITDSDEWLRPIVDIDFQDSSAMARVKKVRSLSLLTLAESTRTRLFLGVNHKGLVGLHFMAFSPYGDERHLEMVRLPYLKDEKPDGEVEHLGLD